MQTINKFHSITKVLRAMKIGDSVQVSDRIHTKSQINVRCSEIKGKYGLVYKTDTTTKIGFTIITRVK